MGGSPANGGPPGGKGQASNYVSIGERGRVIPAGQTFLTSTVQPLRCTGYPRLTFYVVVTADPAAAGVTILEQFAFRPAPAGGLTWDPVRTSYQGALNVPRLNGNTDGHADPAYVPCLAARLSLTAPGGGAITCNWYIAAST